MLTADQWSSVLSKLNVAEKNINDWVPFLSTVITDSTFSGIAELQAYLSQVMVETAKLSVLAENLNYSDKALIALFGNRITQEQATKFGRTPDHPADQQAIANIIYGGEWGVKNLGNTQPNDGWDFRGSGLIQTTGRDNFGMAVRDTGIDFIGSPSLMRTPGTSPIQASLGFWKRRVGSRWQDPVELRKAVNGGDIGLKESIAFADQLKTIMG